jgi:hypothetical protein
MGQIDTQSTIKDVNHSSHHSQPDGVTHDTRGTFFARSVSCSPGKNQVSIDPMNIEKPTVTIR